MNVMQLDAERASIVSLGRTESADATPRRDRSERKMDFYFSADVETDGPIPGPYSMLSFAMVFAGSFDGQQFVRPRDYDLKFYAELKPISHKYESEALRVNNIDRDRLMLEGGDPATVMEQAAKWILRVAGEAQPVLVAYPLSFDWTWLYWYFVNFAPSGSPFNHSRCFDIKTAFAVKAGVPLAEAGRSQIPDNLKPHRAHSHHALDDAIEQAEIFANIFQWEGSKTWGR